LRCWSASLAFLPIVLMNPAPKGDGFRPDIDVSAIARNATGVAGFTPVTPDTGDTFKPNYARWESGTGSGVPTWEVGFLTPKESFIGLDQTSRPTPPGFCSRRRTLPVTGTRNAGGQEWELRDTGKEKRSMVLEYRGTTIILSGDRKLGRVRNAGRRRRVRKAPSLDSAIPPESQFHPPRPRDP
jgi:hypothetical protein